MLLKSEFASPCRGDRQLSSLVKPLDFCTESLIAFISHQLLEQLRKGCTMCIVEGGHSANRWKLFPLQSVELFV